MKARIKDQVGVIENYTLNVTRRLYKLFTVALNKEFGFGEDRLHRLFVKLEAIGKERDTDEAFWYHIDKLCNSILTGKDKFDDENYDSVDL